MEEGLADLELLREPLLPEDRLPPALASALNSSTVTLRNSTAATTVTIFTVLIFIYVLLVCSISG
jgi:hypothetical protein